MKMLRESQGKMSQQEFAKLIKISPTYLSDIYGGRRPPGPSVIEFLHLEKVFRRKTHHETSQSTR